MEGEYGSDLHSKTMQSIYICPLSIQCTQIYTSKGLLLGLALKEMTWLVSFFKEARTFPGRASAFEKKSAVKGQISILHPCPSKMSKGVGRYRMVRGKGETICIA